VGGTGQAHRRRALHVPATETVYFLVGQGDGGGQIVLDRPYYLWRELLDNRDKQEKAKERPAERCTERQTGIVKQMGHTLSRGVPPVVLMRDSTMLSRIAETLEEGEFD
jgi:hypothetical protein